MLTLRTKMLECECGGGKPQLKRNKIAPTTKYYLYVCSNNKCPNTTFSTRKEEFCRELWNAGVVNRAKKNKNSDD